MSQEEKKIPLLEINSHLHFSLSGFRMWMLGCLQKEEILFGHSASTIHSIQFLLSVRGSDVKYVKIV